MQKYIVAFDVSDDKARRELVKVLLSFGVRVQYSVFEVAVAHVKIMEEILTTARQWLDDEDDLRFYRLCESCCDASYDMNNKPIANFPSVILV